MSTLEGFQALLIGLMFLCVFPILFSTVKLKLGHKLFAQFIDRKRWKIQIFEQPRLYFQIFSNSLKSLKFLIFKIGIFEVPLTLYSLYYIYILVFGLGCVVCLVLGRAGCNWLRSKIKIICSCSVSSNPA